MQVVISVWCYLVLLYYIVIIDTSKSDATEVEIQFLSTWIMFPSLLAQFGSAFFSSKEGVPVLLYLYCIYMCSWWCCCRMLQLPRMLCLCKTSDLNTQDSEIIKGHRTSLNTHSRLVWWFIVEVIKAYEWSLSLCEFLSSWHACAH